MLSYSHNSSKSCNVASTSTAGLLAVVSSTFVLVFASRLEPSSSRCLSLPCFHLSWPVPITSSNTTSVRLLRCATSSFITSPFRRHCLVAASIEHNPIKNPNDPHIIFSLLPVIRLDSLSRSELRSTFSFTPSSLFPNLPTFTLPSFIRWSIWEIRRAWASKDSLEEVTWVVISEVRKELEVMKWIWRVEVWVESDDREDTAEIREEIEERSE